MIPASLAERVRGVPIARRLAHGAGWSLIGALIGRFVAFPISVLLARAMGPEQFGELGMVFGSVELFGVFGGFGLGLTATKHIAEFRERDPGRAGRIIALTLAMTFLTGGIAALGLVVLAPWLAAEILAAPHLSGPLRISAALLYLGLVNAVQAASLAGFEAFKRLARLNLVGLLNLPLMVGGYWLGGLSGVLWGAVIGRVAICLLCHRALLAEARLASVSVPFDIRWDELPVMWRFSLPALLGGLLVSPVNWICSTMLVNRPDGYREVGIFNVTNQWYNFILFVPLALASGMLPVLSDRIGNDDLQSSRTVLRLMLKLNGVIAVATVVILSALSPFIMAIYGHEYREGWPTLIVVVFTGAMFIILSPIGDVLAASSRMWLGCLMNFGWSIAYIAMTFLLVGFGSLGLASARLVAYVLHAIWSFWVAYHLLRVRSRPQ